MTFTVLVPVSCGKRACSVGKAVREAKPASSKLRRAAAEAILAKEPPGDTRLFAAESPPADLEDLERNTLHLGKF